MLSVILVETEHAQNLGAVCRVMANFGVKELILINPKCKKEDTDAIKRAKHSAASILKNAKERDFAVLKTFDYLVATTARTGTQFNITRSPLTPEEFAKICVSNNLIKDQKVRVGLVFGREGHGLFNKELKKCDYVATIPLNPGFGTMNLSHAVAIFLYELTKKLGTERIGQKFPKATATEKEIIMQVLEEVLAKKEFKSEGKRETQRIIWKRILGKSLLTKREAYALIGFLRKIL